MKYPCPKGHDSDDADFCSECGSSMGPAQPANVEPCPKCGTPRDGDDRFCGVCRYDFETQTEYQPPAGQDDAQAPSMPAPQPTPAPSLAPVQAPSQTAASALSGPVLPDRRWDVSIEADTGRDQTAPSRPVKTFPLDLAEQLVGRRNDQAGINPEVPVDDDGVSRRHAKIYFALEGGGAVPMILDLNSSNGTVLNGRTIEAGVAERLSDGDRIEIGRFSTLTVRAR